jgi:hypothetical protein
MLEDMKNIFKVLRIAKQNDGRIGKDRTILDENRHIISMKTNGQSTTGRSVSVPIDSVKIDNAQHPANYATDIDGCSRASG